jgi:hypothetical protein
MNELSGETRELNVDFDLPKNRSDAVWEMYRHFKSYRFSQRQILMFIKLLAAELDNEVGSELISKVVGAVRLDTPLSILDEENIRNQVSELFIEKE